MPKLLLPSLFVAAIVVVVILFSPLSDSQNDLNILSPYIVDEQALPELILQNSNGEDISLQDFVQDADLVTAWSPNCSECLEALMTQEKFAKDNNISIKTIAIGTDPESAKSFLAQNNISLPVAFDLSAQTTNYWGSSSPTTVFVNNERVYLIFPGRINQDHLAAILTLIN